MSGAEHWNPILEPDEETIWQGGPVSSFALGRPDTDPFGLGIFVIVAGLIWIFDEFPENSLEQALKYLPFIIGCAITIAALIAVTYRRNRTWYSLSNKRAFIGTDIPLQKRRLKSYSLISEYPLKLIDHDPGTVLFAKEFVDGGEDNFDRWDSVGFEHIPNPQHVYRLIQEIRAQADS